MKEKTTLEGIFPALITPFKKDDEIDEEKLKELLDFLIEKGVHGVVPVGTTGEFMYMTEKEKRKVYEIVVDHVNGKIPVIAGTGASGTEEAIKLAKIAEDIGVDAILVVSPFYLKPSDMGVYQHYHTIANEINIPIVLYNIPQCTGYYISGEVIEDLAEIDNIVALKDSSGNLAYMLEIINRVNGKIKIFVGYDEVVMPALTSGANGAILASANVIPEIWVKIYEKIKNGEIQEAAKLQKSIQKLIRIITRKGGILAVKKAVEMRGIKVRTARKPLKLGGSLTLENMEEIKLELEKLGLISREEGKAKIKHRTLEESFIDLGIDFEAIKKEKLEISREEEGENINKITVTIIRGR
ncbi:MAG TPA: 4-hydroxy-tetrahydrodipicolinate synthase, partial [Candidatus Atribacteria bacterium]|nr:4-hydroxy-tetrahydrodipicolinate synthase [Candidatus Atribacteria bacterium]